MRIVRSRNLNTSRSITLITELQALVRRKLARPNLSIQLGNSSQHRCYAQRNHPSAHRDLCRNTNCRTSVQGDRSHACIRHHPRPQFPHHATSPARPALQPDQAPNCAPPASPEIYLHPVSNRFFLTIHTEPRSQLLFRLEQPVIDGTVCILYEFNAALTPLVSSGYRKHLACDPPPLSPRRAPPSTDRRRRARQKSHLHAGGFLWVPFMNAHCHSGRVPRCAIAATLPTS